MIQITDIVATLPRVGHVVEANDYEQLTLWQKYHGSVEWLECSHGQGKTIGYIDNRCVFMSLRYAQINSVLVLFWHLTSEVADYKMANLWLRENVDLLKDGNVRINDAQNNHILQLGESDNE